MTIFNLGHVQANFLNGSQEQKLQKQNFLDLAIKNRYLLLELNGCCIPRDVLGIGFLIGACWGCLLLLPDGPPSESPEKDIEMPLPKLGNLLEGIGGPWW